MGKKRGKSAKNARRGLGSAEPEEIVKAPHSFVINRGKLGKNANELMMNFRKIMEPFTASHLRVQKHNVVKDFVHMAGPLNVSHLVIFTKSQTNMYLRILKLPRGPTLTFQIKEYSLMKDIVSSQKKPLLYEKLFTHHPLLVLNNFSGEGMHFKLMATMFQNMFPSLNVNKINLNEIRRCLLLHYSDDGIELRQYAIKIVPTGVSKAVKKLIQSRVPDLSKFQDVDEFLQKSGNLSESEVELDSAANTVILPQPISSRGNIASEKSAIRLYEIGPRLKLMLIKIEEGLMTGEVMYHKFIQRTPEEIKILKERIKAKRLLKEKRRTEQQENVERKKKLAEKKEDTKDTESVNNSLSEDDAEWYRTEVGEEADENILPGLKRKQNIDEQKASKKKKIVKCTENNKDKPSMKKKVIKNTKTDKDKSSKKKKFVKSTENDKDNFKKTKTNLVEEFMKKRKKRKEVKEAKKKAKKISQRVLSVKVKRREIKGKKYKKK